MSNPSAVRTLGILAAALLAVTGPLASQTQQGQVAGTVTDQETGQPISGAQVVLQGTGIGALSGQDGAFILANVPVGTYTLLAQHIGYRQLERAGVTVTAGVSTTVNLSMSPAVLMLQEVVATGLVDPVEGVRSPITVNRISREILPVPVAGPAAQTLQGAVPGLSMNRGSGQPGTDDLTMMLRTPTSVVMSGSPLIVVDGVILGSGGTSGIESQDIESIEVIKGAAAASLYGSRAAAGVISITTNRGRTLDLGETRFSVRTELGFVEAYKGRELPTHHQYLVDDAQNPTTYVDATGSPVSRPGRVTDFVAPGIAFMDKPYPGPVFDNLGTVYQPGAFRTYSFSMAQNSASTNFAITLNRYFEQGALENNNGFTRNSFRVNLDHRFQNTLSLGVSAYHSRDHRDNVGPNPLESLFGDIIAAPPDVDLSLKDENGEYVRVPDPAVAFENPLWTEANIENDRHRARTLASANLAWSPFPWLSATGRVSYDRQDSKTREYEPKGLPANIAGDEFTDGRIELENDLDDTWNADVQVSLRRDFGPLNARTTFGTILERDRSEEETAEGQDFFVGGVPVIDAAEVRTSESEEEEIKSIAYLWNTAFDYDGKYILEGLIRRDGSSLFGPDNRWHNYYRIAGAWRIAEEDWFDIPNVDELKVSYARGTAGGRPSFSAQYETWNVGQSGVSKGTLGNRDLRPEHTTEQEVSLEAILFGRFSIDLTHAWQRTTDQLLTADVPAVIGYSSQWTNGGTVSGYTTEVSVEAQVIQGPDFGWSTMFVADRSRAKIEDWPFPCENPAWRYRCSGVGLYEIWGYRFLTSPDDLVAHHGGAAAGAADEFQVNDDGYLVWVGQGNTFRDGLANDLWGTSTTIGGQTYAWGMPILELREDGSLLRQKMGDGSHVNLGWINNFRYRGFSLHTQFHASVGGDAINRQHQGLILEQRAPDMDQWGKPDELKKPTLYYETLYASAGGSTHFMEDGSYLKLRTVALNYRLSPEQLTRFGLGRMGIDGMTLGLIGRNIFTITGYDGFDPEQALNLATRENADYGSYPSTRQWTAEVSVTF